MADPKKITDAPGPLEMEGAKDSIAFMLSRVGASVAEQFAASMSEHGLVPRQFLVLNLISAHEGESQTAISASIGVAKSRMVSVIDELESKKLVERRVNPFDRRQHALFLTKAGRELRDRARESAAELEERIRGLLSASGAKSLLDSLHKVAEIDDTPPGIHPGLAKKLHMEDPH
ncbi:MAG: MarR family winged helix-turn-helix transcriptional regulator [Solirubrobacterales bacterium]